ncbi:sensor histidine kinase [Phenylobacterium sp.]|uniref:sensor histidine kinase n=1 Tax=Phenylobacterium sp. TaxID=1871053 RepID=UPI002E3023E5|nr:HWE histidine kinase domain-containing protein [Phenylobacterium sp.]HEX2558476.1 HWE histidine kinase domain-containing protein [Phenylobacterium sp.]
MRANKAELELLGYPAHEYVGRPVADFHADPETVADVLRRLKAGERLDKYPARLRARDGSIKYVQISSSALFRNGEFVNTRCFTVDVTGRDEGARRLAESEQRVRALLDALPMAVYTTDREGRITYCNEAAVEFAGRRPELGVDLWCVTWKLYWPDGTPLPHDECPMALALNAGEELRGVEAVAERPDGTRATFTPFPTLLRDADGEVTGAINVLVDISERKRAEEGQKVLIDELNHRVKNTLATVQSIARHTQRSAPEDFSTRFEERLLSLSKAHDLLTRRQWSGVGLRELLEQEFAPYARGAERRVRLDGPDLTLPARIGLALGMVVHELATNAAKYGALSADGGQVQLTWTLDRLGADPALAMQWIETGGPPMVEPTRRGFGLRLIERNITRDLAG